MRRKKELPVLTNIVVTDIGAEGMAVARADNMVVFMPMLVPGDIVDVKILKKRKNYCEGIPVRFHSLSPDRIDPVCSHFGICGGCKWQHLPYRFQLHYKEKQVRDSLSRIAKIELPDVNPIIGSSDEYMYRNKLEYTFSNRRWLTRKEIDSGNAVERGNALGFHIPGQFDKVMDIEKCFLQPEPSNEIRDEVRRYSLKNNLTFFDLREQKGFLRNMIIRNSLDGQVMVIFVFYEWHQDNAEGLMEHISKKFPGVTSVMYIINSKRNDSVADLEAILYKGNDHIEEYLDGLKFRIGPKSFYQTNTRQGATLYRVVKELASPNGDEIVYDLYTGTGTIACYLAGQSRLVAGIEYIGEAVSDARRNAQLNGLENTMFIAGDIREVLSGNFITQFGKPDIIITDPPRAGMHESVVKAMLSASPLKIVYVSCNPATQARDLQLLDEKYRVETVQPVDMFPQTHHVENVVLLRHRG